MTAADGKKGTALATAKTDGDAAARLADQVISTVLKQGSSVIDQAIDAQFKMERAKAQLDAAVTGATDAENAYTSVPEDKAPATAAKDSATAVQTDAGTQVTDATAGVKNAREAVQKARKVIYDNAVLQSADSASSAQRVEDDAIVANAAKAEQDVNAVVSKIATVNTMPQTTKTELESKLRAAKDALKQAMKADIDAKLALDFAKAVKAGGDAASKVASIPAGTKTKAEAARDKANGDVSKMEALTGDVATANPNAPSPKAITDAKRIITDTQLLLDKQNAVEAVNKALTNAKTLTTQVTADESRTKALQLQAKSLKDDADAQSKLAQQAEVEAKTANDQNPTPDTKMAYESAQRSSLKAQDDARDVDTEASNVDSAVTSLTSAVSAFNAAITSAEGKNAPTTIMSQTTRTLADQEKYKVLVETKKAEREAEKVKIAADKAALAMQKVTRLANDAKAQARRTMNQTPQGRAEGERVAQQVIQQDINDRKAENERQALERAQQLLRATQQEAAQQPPPIDTMAQPMTDTGLQSPQMDQTQPEVPSFYDSVGDTGNTNIAHFHDEVYSQAAAGDSDVNCLNQLDQCSDPSVAARCGGTCSRDTNGQDQTSDCNKMADLCNEEHFQELLNTYCKGSCAGKRK
ncbi:hypothetical protein DdX_10267 [Ditylenchus destructor]|uniref:Uncharacterized protein n=1 Tax=Ditylenchus destructor TaxID=166010 RepID=A0AAD4N4L9_9BILA|nr:hypothetical protein DdX_10267 [Ditylenchus destructor]